MPNSQKLKIAILEKDSVRRDYLRQLIGSWGYLPFSFEKDIIFLDNLLSLDPELLIISRLPLNKIYRVVYTLKTLNHTLPVLIIPYSIDVEEFIRTNRFDDISMINDNMDVAEAKKIIDGILSGDQQKTVKMPALVIGQTPEMLKIKKMILELSRTEETVLIKGASGTGKEHVARAIHQLSSRANDFFIKVHSAYLNRSLLDSKLFKNSTLKKFVPTNDKNSSERRGTIFFKSIEKMPLSLQGNILYFLDSGALKSLGAVTSLPVDFRIVASANEDIEQLVDKKKFRKDLYFRLNSIDIRLPPLKDRKEDIPLLADYFADRACMESGKSYFDISEKTKQAFALYQWSENVKELEQKLKLAVLNGGENDLLEFIGRSNDHNNHIAELFQYIDRLEEFSDAGRFIQNSEDLSLKEISKNYIAHTEKIYMKKALEHTNWNRKKAAKRLRISYKSLLNKISEYNLS